MPALCEISKFPIGSLIELVQRGQTEFLEDVVRCAVDASTSQLVDFDGCLGFLLHGTDVVANARGVENDP